MKKTVLILSIFIILSCQNDNSLIDKFEEKKQEHVLIDDPEALAALKVIENFINIGSPSIETRSKSSLEVLEISKNTQYVINNTSLRSGLKDSVNIYTFITATGDNTGYAIATGDSRVPRVYAYVEKGSLLDTTYNKGLQEFINSFSLVTEDDLEDYYTNGAFKQDEKITIISTMEDAVRFENTVTTRSTYNTYISTPVFGPKGKWTPNWGQDEPYNDNCPPCNGWFNTPAGCVAVAIAQFLASYSEDGITVSGHDLRTLRQQTEISPNTTHAPAIARLMRQIGTDVNMVYNCFGSESILAVHGVNALNKYKVKHNLQHGSLNYNTAATELIKGNKILTRGSNSRQEGHAWIYEAIRGYGTCTGSYNTTKATISRFEGVYCNWGWSGESNGWFIYHTSVTDAPNNTNDFKNGPAVIYGRVRY